jgi:hypothetical protein
MSPMWVAGASDLNAPKHPSPVVYISLDRVTNREPLIIPLPHLHNYNQTFWSITKRMHSTTILQKKLSILFLAT